MRGSRRRPRRGVSNRSARAPLSVLLALGFAFAPRVASGESPQILYMLQCQGCHLPDGRGLPGSVPDLRDSVARFLVLPEGRAYLVQVPGSASSRLTNAELASVLNWMALAFGPAAEARTAAPYTTEEVAVHRGTPLTDVETARRALIDRMGR